MIKDNKKQNIQETVINYSNLPNTAVSLVQSGNGWDLVKIKFDYENELTGKVELVEKCMNKELAIERFKVFVGMEIM